MALFTNTATALPLNSNDTLLTGVEGGYFRFLTRENNFGYRSFTVGVDAKDDKGKVIPEKLKKVNSIRNFNVDGRKLNLRQTEDTVAIIELRTERNLDLPQDAITYKGEPINPELIGDGSIVDVTIGHRKNNRNTTRETVYVKAVKVVELVVYTPPSSNVDF